MSNETTQPALPKLRFPEFREAGEWDEKIIGDVCVMKGRIGYRGYTVDDIVSKGQGAISLSPSNIDNTGQLKYEKSTYISWAKYEESPEIIVEEGFTVLVKTASCGKTALVKKLPEKSTINPQLVVLKPMGIDSIFLSLLIAHPSVQRQISDNAGGGAIPTLSQERISKFPVFVPYLPEQQRISSCISSLDDLLTAQSAKLAALQAHKRGLMQGLFPAEGETVPKLRFPEFQEAAEWEETTLGKLIEIKGRIGYRGYTVEDIVKEGEGAISLSPSNINHEGNLTFNKATFISWEKYDESPEIMLEDGFTVLVKTGSTYGKAAFVKNLPEKTTINPQIVVLKPTRINSIFLFLLVCNSSIQKQIEAHVVGGAIPTLAQGSMMQFDVLVPDEKEQQKIADCLSALDNRITAQIQRIEALKLHKKGLMQGLFPAAAE